MVKGLHPAFMSASVSVPPASFHKADDDHGKKKPNARIRRTLLITHEARSEIRHVHYRVGSWPLLCLSIAIATQTAGDTAQSEMASIPPKTHRVFAV